MQNGINGSRSQIIPNLANTIENLTSNQFPVHIVHLTFSSFATFDRDKSRQIRYSIECASNKQIKMLLQFVFLFFDYLKTSFFVADNN